MSRESRISYARAFFDGEGSITNNRISFGNTELNLLLYVKNVLSEVGIESTISHPKRRPGRKQMHNLKFWGRKKIKIFYEEIGTLSLIKQKKIEDYLLYGDKR